MIRAGPPWHGLNHATHQRYRPEMSYEQWFAYQRSYVDTAYAGPHLRIMQVPQCYDTTVSATEDTGPTRSIRGCLSSSFGSVGGIARMSWRS
jgi:hypothetical protein